MTRDLRVWSTLEVGPVQLEKRRLRMPYVVHHRDGTQQQAVLTLRWASDVFDPTDLADQQLATLAGAQLGLNYGLFADELVLHGPVDPIDAEWLDEMLDNTATEVWVNKFLKRNVFLTGEPASWHEQPSERPPVARLTLPEGLAAPLPTSPFAKAPDRVAILASGGKESLLTQGVAEELGLDVHALFANESGRHWFTALNGWRHLQRTRPERTARVWMDCDRLYTFFLRQLPFVRDDADRVRADDYPIRMWTVCVFLMGCVPMARARGCGRLFIGDEWDTTQPSTFVHGDLRIEHHAGLYDQSRHFDARMSRYFADKGWNLLVASLLRPASELIVQDTLASRYPALFGQQVSCHAARVEGDRVVPCGRCEKCRRIVGMLTALGHDPAAIGYPPAVQARCLEDLANRGVKQAEDGQHLGALLVERGHISVDTPFGAQGRRHHETTCLRFDPVASPRDVLPRDLRQPVWQLLATHAHGAVEQRGDTWVPIPLADLGAAPHPNEPDPDRSAEEVIPVGRATHRLAELTWPQARRRLRETSVALLPVGAIEQHGPHLPLDIDAWDAAYLCEQVALRCTGVRPLVLPLIPYGVSYHHGDFPGTISVGPETLARMVHEVGTSVVAHGIDKLLIVNGHGGNGPALAFAAQLINRDSHIFVAVDSGETSDAEISALVGTPNDAHAGEFETSTALATRPELVYLEHAHRDVQVFDSPFLDYDSELAVEWPVRTARIAPSGIMGDPTIATAEKGRQMWEIQIRNLARFVDFLQATPLTELHGRGRRDV